ncbi:MAG: NADH-quinone oxidoreductase subunit K [Myxococcota bacterium]
MASTSLALVMGGLALFWVAMLGLLWRRSLIGMLIGVLFGWLSVVVVGIGWLTARSSEAMPGEGAVLLVVFALVGLLQVALGLAIVVARVVRRGTLDVQDAGLLEG